MIMKWQRFQDDLTLIIHSIVSMHSQPGILEDSKRTHQRSEGFLLDEHFKTEIGEHDNSYTRHFVHTTFRTKTKTWHFVQNRNSTFCTKMKPDISYKNIIDVLPPWFYLILILILYEVFCTKFLLYEMSWCPKWARFQQKKKLGKNYLSQRIFMVFRRKTKLDVPKKSRTTYCEAMNI